jgi:hypothetical protein
VHAIVAGTLLNIDLLYQALLSPLISCVHGIGRSIIWIHIRAICEVHVVYISSCSRKTDTSNGVLKLTYHIAGAFCGTGAKRGFDYYQVIHASTLHARCLIHDTQHSATSALLQDNHAANVGYHTTLQRG